MDLSGSAKALLGLTFVTALLGWVVILDFGVSAGRVHHGVSVRGIELGGLTEEEAADRLAERGREMSEQYLHFGAKGVKLNFLRSDAGWRPETAETAAAAMEVGRSGGIFTALGDRLRAWFGGVGVDWAGTPKPFKVTRLVDEAESQAEEAGLVLDRARLRVKIRRALYRYPGPRFYRIPLAE